ncbi:hypothetical protein K437DRAFT_148641 [Tilletiaria anomala UBC 951]|uniref:Uncharacterized protein n=1 Tax=Tilletiaria anomala (strain ATCC 24038 / CBS 436.72 / UBC 951) TaxID=1037660 RepID=A0A066WG98_TILAU|nr:uncharacterized protein K437DRAFT_148641 [Tilletiaria anomala UBC 951]KDN52801.1 hypothetical protein K437DRAFT_148641 [Tilletiaria anomala UBC 951]
MIKSPQWVKGTERDGRGTTARPTRSQEAAIRLTVLGSNVASNGIPRLRKTWRRRGYVICLDDLTILRLLLLDIVVLLLLVTSKARAGAQCIVKARIVAHSEVQVDVEVDVKAKVKVKCATKANPAVVAALLLFLPVVILLLPRLSHVF